jgi:N6-L-threonylcarbamoyladenine synthase
VRYFLESDAGQKAKPEDVAASFQAAVVDVLMARLQAAYERAPYNAVTLSGGVAANSALQAAVRAWSDRNNVHALIPPPKYCTDNAAMIAAAAFYQGEAVRADAIELTANPNLPFEMGVAR